MLWDWSKQVGKEKYHIQYIIIPLSKALPCASSSASCCMGASSTYISSILLLTWFDSSCYYNAGSQVYIVAVDLDHHICWWPSSSQEKQAEDLIRELMTPIIPWVPWQVNQSTGSARRKVRPADCEREIKKRFAAAQSTTQQDANLCAAWCAANDQGLG